MSSEIVNQVIERIIDEQGQIIGTKLAKSRAIASGAVQYSQEDPTGIKITENPSTAIERLIASYQEIFGQASVDVCTDVIRKFPFEEVAGFLPNSLRSSLSLHKQTP